jgi:hypothetical protein
MAIAISLKVSTIIAVCEDVIEKVEHEHKLHIMADLEKSRKWYNFWRKVFGEEPASEREFFNDFKDTHPSLQENVEIERDAKSVLIYYKHREIPEPEEYTNFDYEIYLGFMNYLGEGITPPRL